MDAEIKEKVDQLRREGWCVLERIIPEDAIERVRAHVQEAHAKAQQDYEAIGGAHRAADRPQRRARGLPDLVFAGVCSVPRRRAFVGGGAGGFWGACADRADRV